MLPVTNFNAHRYLMRVYISSILELRKIMAKQSISCYTKPHSRAGNQAQVHLTPRSMIPYSISRKGQAERVKAEQLVAMLCVSATPPTSFPRGRSHRDDRPLKCQHSFGGVGVGGVHKKKVSNNCMVLYFAQAS